jgi:DNA-binding transcriptional regulator YhcF (GntR family)
MIEFDFDSNRPIYIQLVEQLELYIISGKIPPGSRLPSVRDFALQAKVNPNTMQRALAEIEDSKLIYTERTNGKFITTDATLLNKYRERFITNRIQDFLSEMSTLGFDQKMIIKYLKLQGGNK